MTDEESEDRRGFRVTDRRRFDESGEAKTEEPVTRDDPSSAAPAPDELLDDAHAEEIDEPVTFSTFVLGLSTQALLHLGEIPNPLTKQLEPDLVAAKQVIDILGLLADKTRNNLDASEQSLLESALYDLRMRYVALIGKGTKEKA